MMIILNIENMVCPCCMEEHAVQRIRVLERNEYKGVTVEFDADYHYCDRAGEAYEDENQIILNDLRMKKAFREKTGTLPLSLS